MKRFLLILTILVSTLSLLAVNAEARRFGGGSSFGKQRSMSPQRAPAAAPSATSAAGQKPAGSKWLGPLAGLAIGASLGAMFAGGGLGGAMSGIFAALAIGAVIMLLISFFRKKQRPAMQFAGAGSPFSASPEPVGGGSAEGSAATPPSESSIPADFPVDAFLRSAKSSFIRLQAANDRKDLDDIREYTTPEMFAEISMQVSERDDSAQKTDVISVNADLLEVVNETDLAIASVRMTGHLRENDDTSESFDEIWHVQKSIHDDKAVWLLSGIQQIS